MVLSLGCGGSALAQTQPHAGGVTIGGAAGDTHIWVGDDGETHIGVWVEAPKHITVRERAPMAVSLVVDTSGSMAGTSIQNAKMAAASLLETMKDGDRVSIVGFASDITEWSPPVALNHSTRAQLMGRIHQMMAAGGTNMYGGLTLGQSHLRAADDFAIKRLIMISDGHANEGPSDPYTLGTLAAQGTEQGIQITSIGVGVGYDESLLSTLAVNTAGRLYHLEHANQMAIILREESNLLASTVATDTWIEIVPMPGVQILDIESLGGVVENGRAKIKLGSMYAGQKRELLVRAKVNRKQVGKMPLAKAELHYVDTKKREREASRTLNVALTRNKQKAEQAKNSRVQAMVATNRAYKAQVQASRLLAQGNNTAAANQLAAVADDLEEAAQAPSVAPAQRRILRQEAKKMRKGSVRSRAAVGGAAPAAAKSMNDMAMESMGY